MESTATDDLIPLLGPGACEPSDVVSTTYIARPRDPKCRFWSKVFLIEETPLPGLAQDIPGPYLTKGADVEIFHGMVIFEGEEVHHSKKRGWCYRFGVLSREGEIVWREPEASRIKMLLREARAKGLNTTYLFDGSGDIAAMCRRIHAARRGLL